MIVVRNVFRCKPGQAKKLVGMMKEMLAMPDAPRGRVLTDVSAGFWTVVLENESDSLASWEKEFAARPSKNPMEGYMDLVTSGSREIWRVE